MIPFLRGNDNLIRGPFDNEKGDYLSPPLFSTCDNRESFLRRKTMQSPSRMITAGVYVNVAGFFPFQVGPTQRGDTLGVVRLGGHREAEETGWECAAREAFEEASLRVTPRHPPATYWVEVTETPVLQAGIWSAGSPDEIAPILVSTRKEESMTPIYLGYTHDIPQPSGEAKALLLFES
jgi:hypothetical protein